MKIQILFITHSWNGRCDLCDKFVMDGNAILIIWEQCIDWCCLDKYKQYRCLRFISWRDERDTPSRMIRRAEPFIWTQIIFIQVCTQSLSGIRIEVIVVVLTSSNLLLVTEVYQNEVTRAKILKALECFTINGTKKLLPRWKNSLWTLLFAGSSISQPHLPPRLRE